MTGGREIELKLAVPGEDAFRRLAERLAPGTELPRAALQVNHFFDTRDAALRGAKLALRLREEEGRFVVTAKGAARGADDALSDRAEEEVEIDSAAAAGVLMGEESPLDLLARALDPPAPLVDALRGALEGRALLRVGAFENERRRLGPVALGPLRDVTLELDRTTFPGGAVEHEVELEIAADEAEAARAAVGELWRELELEWRTAPSKAQRFFQALESVRRR